MSFLETVERARAFLERNRRVSLRALQREFNLDDEALDELIEELAEIQRVAVRDGRALAWAGETPPAPTGPPARERNPRDYTPKHLADKILQSKSALEGERKQVTVLFADVKGSLELAEQVDPEEWHRILDRFFQILADGVHRFEGTVNQYTGDGIMALFGAPIAHEDHAQRACYAALHLSQHLREYANELRREREISFSVRMGLNSGEVVVAKIGDDLRMDYTAQGHTVGLAARMEELAEPRSIYLTADTAKRVEGFFRLEDLGPFRLRGVEEPVQVCALEGIGPLRTRFDVSRARGLSKFVGRRDELGMLEAALQRAIGGQGQVVGVVGEAGVGKSRLCFELAERSRAQGIPVHEAHAVSHGKALPLLPILELLRATFGIGEQDGAQATRDKVAGRLLLLDRTLEDALPLVFDFLGVPDPERPPPGSPPEMRQRQVFDVMRRMLRARSQREPEVLLIEDLHWIDAASDAFLEQVADAVPGSRTLLLVDFRPDYHARWMERASYQQLSLLPLAAEDAGELLRDLLGSDPTLAGLADRIRAHTGGNPFFVEESVRSLVEAGTLEGDRGAYRLVGPLDRLSIPDTVQAVLAARIDRLAEQDKQVLQAAAVIGKRFAESLLGRALELPEQDLSDALRSLVNAEFVYEELLYPEAEYVFAHPLTQEVAYQSQLGDRRQRVHAAVARALEELASNSNRADERAALLAHHWEAAGEARQAVRWHRRAAAWAGLARADDALGHWRRVRELLAQVPESPETIALALEACTAAVILGVRSGGMAKDVAQLLAEGRALAARSPDPGARVRFLQADGTYQSTEGSVRDAADACREAVRLADELGEPELRVNARLQLPFVLLFTGPLAEGSTVVDEILELRAGDPSLGATVLGYDPRAYLATMRSFFLAYQGRMAEAEQNARRAHDLARDEPALRAQTEQMSALLAHLKGDGPVALVHARRAVEIAERLGAANFLGIGYGITGMALVLERRWPEALEAFERVRERGLGYARVFSAPALARAWLGLGEESRARSAAAEALSSTQRSGAKVWEVEAHLTQARVLSQTQGASARAEIESALTRARALIEEIGFRIREPWIPLERAELLRVLGDEVARQRELREAHRLFTEMGATGHAERLARELGL
jgi:class 3 adenylate cyclase